MTLSLSRPTRSWSRRLERWSLPAVLMLAFALRVHRLGEKNIWWDEGFTIALVRKDLLGATLRTAADVHPPLYYWQLWPWVRLAGDGEFAARLLSVALGVLTVAVAYALGKRLGGRSAGLAGALMLAVARFHIWWSQELRMHVLATLAVALTLYVTVRWLEEERKRTRLAWPVLYALAAAACLYSLYMAGVGPLAANLYALVVLLRLPSQRRRGAIWRWLGAQVAALALLAPWLAVTLPRMQSWSKTYPFGMRLLLKLYATILGLGVSTDLDRHLIYLLPFALVLAGGLATLLLRWRSSETELPGWQAVYLLAAALASMPLAVYLVTRPRSLFHTPRVEARYLLLTLPAFSVLVGWCVARLRHLSRLLGAVALASCVGVAAAFLPGYYGERYLHDEMQSMLRIVAAYAQPDDVLLLISGDRYPIFDYHYQRIVPPERRIPVLPLPQTAHFDEENVGWQLAAATADRQRFWVLAYEVAIQDPVGLSLPWLHANHRPLLTFGQGHNGLILFGEEAGPLRTERSLIAPQQPLAVHAGGLELLGYDLPARECEAGDVVNLGLYWTGEVPLSMEVQWRRDSGEVLQSLAQEWPAIHPAVERAAFRFPVAPGYAPGGTHLLLRWQLPGEDAPRTLRLPGPRLRPAPVRAGGEGIAQPLEADLAGGIRLRGFDLQRPVQGGVVEASPGESLTLDLYWEATQPVEQNYTVFTHLLGASTNPKTGSRVWAQHDGPPGDGRYATQTWVPGQLVPDRHQLTIDPEAPPGEYELEIGMYLAATGERLRLRNADGTPGDDRVVVARVRLP